MTIPNILTVFRVLLIPIFIYELLQNDPLSRWIALLIFIIASITDFLDGYLARKLKQESKFGRFLDPLADKALVVTAIMAFVYLDNQIPLWMVLVIIGRDMLITVLRFLAIRKGMEVKTTFLGKAKTAFQMISIVLIIMILIVRSHTDVMRETYKKAANDPTIIHSAIAFENFLKWVKILPDKNVPQRDKRETFANSWPYFIMLLATLVTAISGFRYLFTNFRILKPPYYLRSPRPPPS